MKVYALVMEAQHPYSKDTLAVFASQIEADRHCKDRNTRAESPHIQYLVEEIPFFN